MTRLPDVVRVWTIRVNRGKRATTYSVRWSTSGRRHHHTFGSRKHAEQFRADLLVAARDAASFDLDSGLPSAMAVQAPTLTFYDLAVEYVDVRWPFVSPRHRRSLAEALTDLTLTLIAPADPKPDELARRALYSWAFSTTARQSELPAELETPLRSVRRRSLSLSQVEKPATIRQALTALALLRDGSPAAAATFTRKRATFNAVLEYAVEQGHLASNPLRRVRFRTQRTTAQVDRRVVVNPTQARALLAAVEEVSPTLVAYFACLYFAGLRPAEARGVRRKDLTLPESGWGELLLTTSQQTAGGRWTDDGAATERRQLKHRAREDYRTVPLPPELVQHLRTHISRFLLGVDGMLFVSRTGRAGVPIAPPFQNPVAMGATYRVWHRARAIALTSAQAESLLARRPYDLRHACVSTWLNAGVPAAQVAAWAGHGVDVLLRVYAKCIDGQENLAKRRIEEALRDDETDL